MREPIEHKYYPSSRGWSRANIEDIPYRDCMNITLIYSESRNNDDKRCIVIDYRALHSFSKLNNRASDRKSVALETREYLLYIVAAPTLNNVSRRYILNLVRDPFRLPIDLFAIRSMNNESVCRLSLSYPHIRIKIFDG